MADMGFLPQVDWLLRRIASGAPDACSSPPPSTATSTGSCSRHLSDPVCHEVASHSTTVDSMEHRFLRSTRWTR